VYNLGYLFSLKVLKGSRHHDFFQKFLLLLFPGTLTSKCFEEISGLSS
jgi:hypothetical protein